jgi:hypothetical protein
MRRSSSCTGLPLLCVCAERRSVRLHSGRRLGRREGGERGGLWCGAGALTPRSSFLTLVPPALSRIVMLDRVVALLVQARDAMRARGRLISLAVAAAVLGAPVRSSIVMPPRHAWAGFSTKS